MGLNSFAELVRSCVCVCTRGGVGSDRCAGLHYGLRPGNWLQ